VRMVAGRVESFGRLDERSDMYGRPVTNFQPGDPGFPQTVPVVVGVRPQPAPQDAARTDFGSVGQLQTLKELGALDPEEFEAAKARLLSP